MPGNGNGTTKRPESPKGTAYQQPGTEVPGNRNGITKQPESPKGTAYQEPGTEVPGNGNGNGIPKPPESTQDHHH